MKRLFIQKILSSEIIAFLEDYQLGDVTNITAKPQRRKELNIINHFKKLTA